MEPGVWTALQPLRRMKNVFLLLLGDSNLPLSSPEQLNQGLSLSHGWMMVRMDRTEDVNPQAPTKPCPVG